MKAKIKSLIRKYTSLTYLVIGIIGALFILVGAIINLVSNSDSTISNIFIGVGGSLVATSIASYVLLIALPDDSELKTWGIVKIHENRRTATFPLNSPPKKHLDFIAFGLKNFRSNSNIEKILIERIKNGLKVRIITLHPNSEFIDKHQEFENTIGLQKEIADLIQWVKSIKGKLSPTERDYIEIKLYDNLPLDFYCRADSTIWVGPYLPGIPSSNLITYEFDKNSKGGKQYFQSFDNYWNNRVNINIIEEQKEFVIGNQKESIESILKYFCNVMKGDAQNAVIGVVVLFKDGKRRTFYSCNKNGIEMHNHYPISNGVVGELYNRNIASSAKKVLFFRDYFNKISIISTKIILTQTKKIDFEIELFTKNNTDTKAILAAPIYLDGKMIGALTFDFTTLSTEYNNSVKYLTELQFNSYVDNNHILHQWFDMAFSCADIISHMLGNRIDTNYTKLYEAEWKNYEK